MTTMAEPSYAGVEPGGLTTTMEIEVLICYMLKSVGQPIDRDDLSILLVGGGMANYFDTQTALEELIRRGHITETVNAVCIAPTGEQIAEELSRRIPYTLRDRSVKAALQTLKRREIEHDNPVAIRPLEDGAYAVDCTIRDGERDLLTVSLRVTDMAQAEAVRENFLKDPAVMYRSVMAVLSGDSRVRQAGAQIIIDLL